MLNDAWRAVAELAASQHGVFTRSQAAVHRIDHRRIRTAVQQGRIIPVSEQVFAIAGSPRSYLQDLQVATLIGSGAVVSHRAAAALLKLDGIRAGVVEVSVPHRRPIRLPESVVATVHRVTPFDSRDMVTVGGLPCTGKARTLADLGAVVSPDLVLKALIGALRDGLPISVVRATVERLHRPGPAGTGVLLRHLETLRTAGAAPESWLEEVLRRILLDERLPKLVPQYELRAGGKVIARFDHAFPEVRLAIEGHSRAFHFGPVNEARDADRDLAAARHGWEILYLGWFATKRPAEVVTAVLDVVRQRRGTTRVA